MHADDFLRAMMRDVAWGFFYGWVNFDEVIGTRNHYGKVDMYAGAYNASFKEAGVDYMQQFETPLIMATFKAILKDWVNEGFDPFAAPEETGSAFGTKHGDNIAAIERIAHCDQTHAGPRRRFAAARRSAGQPPVRRRRAGRAGDSRRAGFRRHRCMRSVSSSTCRART